MFLGAWFSQRSRCEGWFETAEERPPGSRGDRYTRQRRSTWVRCPLVGRESPCSQEADASRIRTDSETLKNWDCIKFENVSNQQRARHLRINLREGWEGGGEYPQTFADGTALLHVRLSSTKKLPSLRPTYIPGYIVNRTTVFQRGLSRRKSMVRGVVARANESYVLKPENQFRLLMEVLG